MATWYVDPAATGGGTGVDWTNAYTTLNACITAKYTGALSEAMTINCRTSGANPADEAGVTIDGGYATASYPLTIQCAQVSRPVGKWDATKYRLSVTGGYR